MAGYWKMRAQQLRRELSRSWASASASTRYALRANMIEAIMMSGLAGGHLGPLDERAAAMAARVDELRGRWIAERVREDGVWVGAGVEVREADVWGWYDVDWVVENIWYRVPGRDLARFALVGVGK